MNGREGRRRVVGGFKFERSGEDLERMERVRVRFEI